VEKGACDVARGPGAWHFHANVAIMRLLSALALVRAITFRFDFDLLWHRQRHRRFYFIFICALPAETKFKLFFPLASAGKQILNKVERDKRYLLQSDCNESALRCKGGAIELLETERRILNFSLNTVLIPVNIS